MKGLKTISSILLLLMIGISSCIKEEDNPVETEIPEVLVTASIEGTVVNESGVALENVDLYLRGNTTSTDVNGVFSFSNIEMNQNGALVSAEKDGYFNNTKVLITRANQTSFTKIMLVEKKLTASFEATTGGEAITNGGAIVDIPSNAVQLEGGGSYNGTINVFATWLDPTAEDLNERMPGDLRATNADNETVKLATYGMIGVELEGANGEALNIAEGQTATIELPVPDELLGSAPATIPLWHFDEATGYWVEDGEGTLTADNTYVGTVSHFSYWNYDLPYPYVTIQGLANNEDGEGVSWLPLEISITDGAGTIYGYTDGDGIFEGFVPKDEPLTLTVFGKCGEPVYTSPLGPFSEDAIVPTFEVSSSATNVVTLFGVLHDCSDMPESDGYVKVEYGEFYFDFIDVNQDGSFSGSIDVCDLMEVTVSGISNDPFSQGTTVTYPIDGNSDIDVDTLISCW